MSWGQNYFVSTDWQEILPPKLTKNREFLKNCQIVWFFVVIYWQSDRWLSCNCQPIVWMVCWWKGIKTWAMFFLAAYTSIADALTNCQMKRIIRWKEFRRQELYALAESWKQEYGCCNINLLGRRLTANLPIRGKHRAHDGQARCPSWASSVPNLIQTDIRIKCALI